MLEITALRKSFGRRVVLDSIDLSAAPGDLVVVTGDSGAGKTTLLKLIHGQVRPDRGQLWLSGHPLHRRLLRGTDAVRRQTGFVFQDHRLLPRLNALENVIYGVQVSRPDVPFGVIRKAALEALDVLGLGTECNHFPHQMSTGERQRVAVARALAVQPRLILADEPTASLDERASQLVMRQLRLAAAGGALVIVATHHLGLTCTTLVNLPRLAPVETPRRLAAAVGRRVPGRRGAQA